MGLPRPINWLREASVDEEQILAVQQAAQGVKEALETAQAELAQMESDNANQVENLNASLRQAMSNIVGQSGGAPTTLFTVYQWWGFAETAAQLVENDEDIENRETIAANLRGERFLCVPFKSVELAGSWLSSKVDLLQVLARQGLALNPVNIEDTPNDVLSRVELQNSEGEIIGYMELKFWQYNPDIEIPAEAGGGTGDWV